MNLEINQKEMLQLMTDFHTCTGLTIVLFDANETPILTVPTTPCKFCGYMKQHQSTFPLCCDADRKAMALCREKKQFIIYRCHAGLSEACAPLILNDQIAGYFMFGQISSFSDRENLERRLRQYAANATGLSFSSEITLSDDILYKSEDQIRAAARMMDSLAHYSIQQEAVRVQRHNFITNMGAFIREHLSEDLNVEYICRELGVSRSKLYQVSELYLGKGIASYVLELRIARAKELLSSTDLPITSVCEQCGFKDYNYFCRVFKKETGMSAGNYRRDFS